MHLYYKESLMIRPGLQHDRLVHAAIKRNEMVNTSFGENGK